MSLFLAWLLSFALTQAVEVPLWGVLGRRWVTMVVGAGTTCLTHPLLWAAFVADLLPYPILFVVGEVVVTLVEGLALCAVQPELRWRRGLAISAVVNAASILVGLTITALGWR